MEKQKKYLIFIIIILFSNLIILNKYYDLLDEDISFIIIDSDFKEEITENVLIEVYSYNKSIRLTNHSSYYKLNEILYNSFNFSPEYNLTYICKINVTYYHSLWIIPEIGRNYIYLRRK